MTYFTQSTTLLLFVSYHIHNQLQGISVAHWIMEHAYISNLFKNCGYLVKTLLVLYYNDNCPCVFQVNYGFTRYILTTFHVEVKGNIVMIGKEFIPGGNVID